MAGMENVVTARYVKELVEEQGKTHREVADILRQQHPGVNGLSERSVRRFCATNGIRRYDSRVTGVDVHNVVTSAIAEVGATYGRKMMTGHIKHSTGLRLGVNRVGQALKRVNPRQHHERQTSITRHLNPVPYYAEYFGHKLHLDQNEKLIRYGVTEVIAVDGYSSFITAASVMPLKNNITIYRDVFRETILRHGLFDQVRVDHGREFYLVLTVQDHLKELRNNTSRQPYIQTQSKQNHAVERLWVEVNCRTNYPIKRALVQMENDGVIDIEDEVTKFCVSWVAKKVVEVGLSYVVNSWNSHPIPGKGVPLQRRCTNNKAAPVDGNVVPTVESAVQMFRGDLTQEHFFGRDPLAANISKADTREREFTKYFPSFKVLFNEIANTNYNPFQDAVLYFLRLTDYLARA